MTAGLHINQLPENTAPDPGDYMVVYHVATGTTMKVRPPNALNGTWQPLDSTLTDLSGASVSTFGIGLLATVDAPAMRTTLGLVIGTNVQAYSSALTTLASGVTLAAGKTLTVNNSVILAGTDGSTLNIGAGGTLSTMAFQSAGSVAITGGVISGVAITINTGGLQFVGTGAADTRANLGLSSDWSAITSKPTTIAGYGITDADLAPDIQTPTFTSNIAAVTLAKPRTVIYAYSTSVNPALTVKLTETAVVDGWEVEVYLIRTGGGAFNGAAHVNVTSSTGLTAYMELYGQGISGSSNYYGKMRWNATIGKWIRTNMWEATNSFADHVTPMGAGAAWMQNIGSIGSTPGVVLTSDNWFLRPPGQRTVDVNVTNGQPLYAEYLVGTGYTFPDHSTFQLYFTDQVGTASYLPPGGSAMYELNFDGAGVTGSNVAIVPASLNAVDVWNAMMAQINSDSPSVGSVITVYFDAVSQLTFSSSPVTSVVSLQLIDVSGNFSAALDFMGSGDGNDPFFTAIFGFDGDFGSALSPMNHTLLQPPDCADYFTVTELLKYPFASFGPFNCSVYLNSSTVGNLALMGAGDGLNVSSLALATNGAGGTAFTAFAGATGEVLSLQPATMDFSHQQGALFRLTYNVVTP